MIKCKHHNYTLIHFTCTEYQMQMHSIKHKKSAIIAHTGSKDLHQPVQSWCLIKGLHCMLTESMDAARYIEQQSKPRSECADMQADLS